MVTVETAEAIVCETINTATPVIDCVSESDKYFIFGIASVDSDGNTRPLIAPPIGVNKETGKKTILTPARLRGEIASIKLIR